MLFPKRRTSSRLRLKTICISGLATDQPIIGPLIEGINSEDEPFLKVRGERGWQESGMKK